MQARIYTSDLSLPFFFTCSLMEQELLTLPKHPSSTPAFSGVHVTQSLVLYVSFVDRCLSFCTFSFGHCVVFFFDIRILIAPLVSSNSSPYPKGMDQGNFTCITLDLHFITNTKRENTIIVKWNMYLPSFGSRTLSTTIKELPSNWMCDESPSSCTNK